MAYIASMAFVGSLFGGAAAPEPENDPPPASGGVNCRCVSLSVKIAWDRDDSALVDVPAEMETSPPDVVSLEPTPMATSPAEPPDPVLSDTDPEVPMIESPLWSNNMPLPRPLLVDCAVPMVRAPLELVEDHEVIVVKCGHDEVAGQEESLAE